MPKIFICYRRDDNPYLAQSISKDLEERYGAGSIAIDVHIPAGKDFREYLKKQIYKCDVFLAIIGDKWLEILRQKAKDGEHDFVPVEIQTAIKMEISIVPVLIGNASMPIPTSLPPELEKLAYLQAMELRAGKNYQDHLKKIIDSVDNLLKPEGIITKPIVRKSSFIDAIKALQIKLFVVIAFLTLSLATIVYFQKELFIKLWEYDPFLVYYIIGTLALLTFIWVVLKFTKSDAQREYTKLVFLLFIVLVTIAVIWRGIIDLVYILGPCNCITLQCQPPGLYTSHNFLPYVALFAIAVPVLVWIINIYTKDPSEQESPNRPVEQDGSNRSDIRRSLKFFFIYLIACRLVWEILDQIAKLYKPCF